MDIWIYIYMYTDLCIFIYIDMYTCKYIYIYVNIYMYRVDLNGESVVGCKIPRKSNSPISCFLARSLLFPSPG